MGGEGGNEEKERGRGRREERSTRLLVKERLNKGWYPTRTAVLQGYILYTIDIVYVTGSEKPSALSAPIFPWLPPSGWLPSFIHLHFSFFSFFLILLPLLPLLFSFSSTLIRLHLTLLLNSTVSFAFSKISHRRQPRWGGANPDRDENFQLPLFNGTFSSRNENVAQIFNPVSYFSLSLSLYLSLFM